MEFGENPKRSRHCENIVQVRSFYFIFWKLLRGKVANKYPKCNSAFRIFLFIDLFVCFVITVKII